MGGMTRRLLAGALTVLALGTPLAARGASDADARHGLERARGDLVTAAEAYRAALERLIPFRDAAVRRVDCARGPGPRIRGDRGSGVHDRRGRPHHRVLRERRGGGLAAGR